jgi:hypothetical protein
LSAILGVVNVKIHRDTIKELIMTKLTDSAIPAEQKSKIVEAMNSLSEAGIKAAVTNLVQNGLNHVPDLLEWVRNFL